MIYQFQQRYYAIGSTTDHPRTDRPHVSNCSHGRHIILKKCGDTNIGTYWTHRMWNQVAYLQMKPVFNAVIFMAKYVYTGGIWSGTLTLQVDRVLWYVQAYLPMHGQYWLSYTVSMPTDTEMVSFLNWYQAPTPKYVLVSAGQCPTSCCTDCASVPTAAAAAALPDTDSTMSWV